jgi:hypothetical protein
MPCSCIVTPMGNTELPSLEVEDGRLVDFEEDCDA